MRFSRVKGTRDLLPPETERWAAVEAAAREIFGAYGFGEVRTPALEPTELFARSVGETTDIVHKEMYTFPDRKGRSLTLRPENTAGVVRAIIEEGLASGPMPLRLWYAGPQFRYERPQKGRFREFRQIGAELFGAAGPAADAELLVMLFQFLRRLGFERLSVSLNCVGRGAAREAFVAAVREALRPKADALGDDDRRRLEDNPLRLFDSKDPQTREALASAPTPVEFLDDASRAHYDALKRLLAEQGLPFTEDPRLVRGLDYYTTTVFEVSSSGLGAQDAILGGGRYDNLVADLGGPDLPAIGFAIGEDRLIEAMPADLRTPRPYVLVIPMTSDEVPYALRVAGQIRKASPWATVETDLAARGFKKGLARASEALERAGERGLDRRRVDAVLLGPDERGAERVTIKNLAEGSQTTVSWDEMVRRFLAAPPEGRFP
jgi:histidyl-tRNA synthetase